MRSFTNRGLLRIAAAVVLALTAGFAGAQTTHCVPNSFSGSCNDSHATIQAADHAQRRQRYGPRRSGDLCRESDDRRRHHLRRCAGGSRCARPRGRRSQSGDRIDHRAGGRRGLVSGGRQRRHDHRRFSFIGGTRAIESTGGPIDNLLIQNNHIASFTNAGIFLNNNGIDITASQNVIDGTSKTGGGGLFHLDTDNFSGFRLEDNIIRNGATGTGFFTDGNNNVLTSVNRAPRIAGNLIIDNNTGMNLGSRAFDGGVGGAFIENNTFESNNFDGLQGGIQNTTIQTNIFRDNGRSGLALTSFGNLGVDRGAQNLTITCNAFSGNLQEALFFSSTQAVGTIATNQAHNNNIAGNVAGATYNGIETINVDNNWWGSATGPTVASNPGGTGDSLSGTGAAFFDYTPFLTFTAVCVPGQAAPDLVLDKIVDDPTPGEGDTVTFTITITNNGGPATLVSVSDLLPAGLTYASDVPSQGTYTPGTGVWDVGTVNSPGGTATLQITATVNAGTAGSTITNTATLTTSTPADSTPGDNSDSASVTVAQPDLSVTKSVDDNTPQEGQSVTFTVTVTNSGTGDATLVTVTDLLPAGLTYFSDLPSQGSYVSGTGVWTVGTVPASGSATLQIVATVNAGTAGTTITNTATLTSSTPADPTPGDNSDSESLDVGQPDLSITKTADSNLVQSGFPVTFTITVMNSGDGDATSVTVTDLLPPGLVYVSDTPSQGSYDSGTGIWTVGAIAAGGNATLQIVANVTGFPGTSYVNSAAITASTPADATPGDNTDTEGVTVAAALPAIPSLSPLGLLILVSMLAGTAFMALRR